MNHIPTFTKGKPIYANSLNKLGDSAKYSNKAIEGQKNTNRFLLNPFDVIYKEINEDGLWQFKINPAYYYQITDVPIEIIYGATALTDHPIIVLQGSYNNGESNLVFNYSTRKLGWQQKTQSHNLLVLEIEYFEDGGIRIHNRLKEHIDIRRYPPFTPLVVNDGYGGIEAGLTPGYVVERIVTTDDAVKAWSPVGLLDTGDIEFYAIQSTQQLSVIVKTNDEGAIDGGEGDAVYLAIETDDTPSVHFQPYTASESSGTDGEYHYPMVQNGGTTKVFGGSHIYYDEDIDQLNNTLDPAGAAANEGRIVREWNESDKKWELRRIKTDSPQMVVAETNDHVTVRGNSKDGSYSIFLKNEHGDILDSAVLNWEDGLVTDNGAIDLDITITSLSALSGGIGDLDYTIGNNSPVSLIDWNFGLVGDNGNHNIPIPELAEGDNISISSTNNVHTISCTLTATECNCPALSTLYDELQLYVCISGTPTLKTFLVKK